MVTDVCRCLVAVVVIAVVVSGAVSVSAMLDDVDVAAVVRLVLSSSSS